MDFIQNEQNIFYSYYRPKNLNNKVIKSLTFWQSIGESMINLIKQTL